MQFIIAPTPFKTKIIHEIDYSDFDLLIHNHYGRKDYEFAADKEAINDSCYSFHIKKEPICSYNLPKLEQFINGGKFSYITRTLLQDLCNKEIIPEGEYIIKVSW